MNYKRILISIVLAFSAIVSVRADFNADAWTYINTHRATALEHEHRYGVPASITLAQGILESGCGKSGLTLRSNNHFGIKGVGPAGSVKAKDDEPGLSTFCAYHTAAESFEHHARLLSKNSPRYGRLHQYSTYDYRSWAHGLKSCGYATAPDYAESLIGLIERFHLYDLNNGRKLRGSTKLVIVGYRKVPRKRQDNSEAVDSIPVIDDNCVQADDVMSDEESTVARSIDYFPVVINDVPCTILMPGQTIGTICRDNGIDSIEQLLAYNDATNESEIKEGNVVFLDKKQDKFVGARDYYDAHQNDTLRDVSQRFGIKLKRLAKLNHLPTNALLHKGMRIKLK